MPVPPPAPKVERPAAPAQPVSAPKSEAVPPWDDQPEPPLEEPPSVAAEEPSYLRDVPDLDAAPVETKESARAPALATTRPTVILPSEPDPLSDRWAALVAELVSKGLITALVRELAMQAQCIGQKELQGESTWTLRVERESLRTDMQRERLSNAMCQLLGHPVQLELVGGQATNTPAMREQAAREARQIQAEQIISNDPLVVSLLEQFPGSRIVAGSIRPM